MTTKILTGAYQSGYFVTSLYTGLELTSTATVGGAGIDAAYSGQTVTNLGHITASAGHDGVYMPNGGTVTNGDVFDPGNIYGDRGIAVYYGSGTVVNYSYIGGRKTGIGLYGGAGQVTNSGSIRGKTGYGVVVTAGAGTVNNSGTILGYMDGVLLRGGGSVTNGSLSNPSGLIEGNVGVASSGAVDNFATIRGAYDGILTESGSVTNGAATDRGALIQGENGVIGFPGTVTNFGTILGGASFYQNFDTAVSLNGGVVTNGSSADTTALIQGFNGVTLESAGSVANYGVIHATGTTRDIYGNGVYGVVLDKGGQVTNGPGALSSALIEGYGGVWVKAGAGTVANLGTIESTGARGQYGVNLFAGTLTNGLSKETKALIEGPSGVKITSAGSVINYGTIEGSTTAGMTLLGGGKVFNGNAKDKSAVIEGYYHGVASLGAATSVTNFGTIRGSALYSAGVYEAGAGAVVTNGNGKDQTALIAGATGLKLNGPGTVVNSATITGSRAAGVLANGGAVTNAIPSALIQGVSYGIEAKAAAETVKNLGTVRATGGVGVALGAGGNLTNGAARTTDGLIEGFTGVTVAAGAAATVTNFGAIDGQGGAAVQFNSAADVLVVEAASSFTGAVNGDGGTIVLASGTGAATLLAGDSLTVSGSMAATTFSDFATVEVGAAGTFTVAAGGTLAAGQSLIDEGRLTVAGALANTGTLEVAKGVLTVDGAVTGTGQAVIAGGTLDFASAFSQNVTFSGPSGVLKLAQSQGYAGSITGFSLTGGTSLDLKDIGFKSAGEATFSGNAVGGVLTVTDGTHTAHITLVGNYTGSTFVASSDGHGGTTVVDPPAGAATAPPHAFIAAMASFGVGGAASAVAMAQSWRQTSPTLLAPRMQVA